MAKETTSNVKAKVREISDVIQRDELITRLDVGLAIKVGVITAPTAFGRTILARDFPSAGVMLDDYDNDVTRFRPYICSSRSPRSPNG